VSNGVATLDPVLEKVQSRAGTIDLCFAFVLELRAAPELGNSNELRVRIKSQLDATRRALRQSGVSESDIQDMLYAVVALIDETISVSGWSQSSSWLTNPLQQELFGRSDAGEEFFTRLTRLQSTLPEKAPVLSAYYYSLALGFQGKYLFLPKAELDVLTDTVRRQLLESHPTERALSPKGQLKDRFEVVPPEGIPVWVVWAGAALLAVLTYLFYRWRISNQANELIDTINAALPVVLPLLGRNKSDV
jgi:type VI secretion system protein ImpK